MNGTDAVTELRRRFWQTERRVEKEIASLRDVAQRLFLVPTATAEWVVALVAIPEGRDRLEAFAAKFSRVQDGIVDKLLPRYLAASGEKTASVLDNLRRAEQIGLLENPDWWLVMRALRNRLVHEYVEDPLEFAAALNLAREMMHTLLAAAFALRDAAEKQFPEDSA